MFCYLKLKKKSMKKYLQYNGVAFRIHIGSFYICDIEKIMESQNHDDNKRPSVGCMFYR